MVNWHDYLEYHDGTLIRRVTTNNRSKAGSVAGRVSVRGYVVFMHDRKLHSAHRVVWEMFNGPLDKGIEIDHINHDRTDNRIENLRAVDRTTNGRNISLGTLNKSGHLGVSKHTDGVRWVAGIKVNGKRKHLGLFERIEDAIKVRKQAEVTYGFHPNHGSRAAA